MGATIQRDGDWFCGTHDPVRVRAREAARRARGPRPKLLDLFCCQGGAAKGYHDAGFDVVGVDLHPQPRYPYRFIQGDALQVVRAIGHLFDFIHASPPCQRYAGITVVSGDPSAHPDLIDATRGALDETGKLYAIENVMQAPLRNAVVLCGAMFPGLRVYRHRQFECNWQLVPPEHPKHIARVVPERRKPRRPPTDCEFVTVCGDVGVKYAGPAMGIDWMTGNGLSQAIPPAYTEYVGREVLEHMAGWRVAS